MEKDHITHTRPLGLWHRGVNWVKRGRQLSLGLALAGVGVASFPSLLWAAPLEVGAQPCVQENPSSAPLASSACCSGQTLQGTRALPPHLSADFSQTLCQLLVLPTASRSEAENFFSQVEPNSVLSNTSASADSMTLPSLWWTRDSIPSQLGRNRLVDAWISYAVRDSGVQVVDVVVNAQFWRALTLAERYGVLSKFGTSAQEFGYYLRFFQSNGYTARLIGLYACDSTQAEATTLSTTATTGGCLASVNTTQIVQLQQALAPAQGDPVQQASQSAAPEEPTATAQIP